jgi:excisionase family DNA binding protein
MAQAAAYLQLSRKTIARWRDQRLVPYIQLPNGMTRFSRRELDAWIETRRRSPRR